MKTSQREIINVCVWGTVFFFVIRCMISWNQILVGTSVYDLYGYAGEAIGLSIIIAGLYEKVLWRINPFEKTPKLAKHYVGTLKSSYDNVERRATIDIKQTLMSIHITMVTGESKSNSIAASIDEISGEMKLTYCYLNTPKSEYRKKSQIHYGTAILSISNPANLDGQYYTDRETIGDMHFLVQE